MVGAAAAASNTHLVKWWLLLGHAFKLHDVVELAMQ